MLNIVSRDMWEDKNGKHINNKNNYKGRIQCVIIGIIMGVGFITWNEGNLQGYIGATMCLGACGYLIGWIVDTNE